MSDMDFDVDAMMADPLPYQEARRQIKSGDLLFLHHEFVPTLYGAQIELVQEFTGPFAHVAILDWIVIGGVPRLCVWESVVPKFRMVPITATVEGGAHFIWLPMDCPMSDAELGAAWELTGKGDYSKPGAVRAGLALKGYAPMPADERKDPRMWCAKSTDILRALAGVDLGGSFVPTATGVVARKRGGVPRFVRMEEVAP